MDWLGRIFPFWPHVAACFTLLASLLFSAHALLHKRDVRAATLWIGLIWLMPALGPLLYLVLGVNRIRRRALRLGVQRTAPSPILDDLDEPDHEGAEHLISLARVVGRVVAKPLTAANRVQPFVNGDEAFPAMLAAIESAKESIALVSYIFDNDASGEQFANALGRAVKRGVVVRVLVDAAGTRYSWPPITHRLNRLGVRCAKFLPTSVLTPWRVATVDAAQSPQNHGGRWKSGLYWWYESPARKRALRPSPKTHPRPALSRTRPGRVAIARCFCQRLGVLNWRNC